MKTVTVKDLVIGTGAPKIIVSLMAKDIASVKSEALIYREADFDILEWRVDHFADLSCVESVMAAAKAIREIMPKNHCCLPSAAPKKAVSRHFRQKRILRSIAQPSTVVWSI